MRTESQRVQLLNSDTKIADRELFQRLPELSISILPSTVAAQYKLLKVSLRRYHAFVVRTLDEVVKRSDSLVSGRDLSLKWTWVLVAIFMPHRVIGAHKGNRSRHLVLRPAILGIGSSQGKSVRYEYCLP